MRNLNRVLRNILLEKKGESSLYKGNSFDYVEENEMFSSEPMYEIMLDEGETCEQCGGIIKEGETCEQCGMKEGEVMERKKLTPRQKRELDVDDDDKITALDFKYLRRNKQERKESRDYSMDEEMDEGNAFTAKLKKTPKGGKFKMGGKTYVDKSSLDETEFELAKKTSDFWNPGKKQFKTTMYEYEIYNEHLKKNIRLTEEQIIDLIETLSEQKLKNTRGYDEYEKSHRRSGKENDDYFKDVTKKMKDYMKDGSEESFTMDAKHFPMGNGELKQMKKMAYVPSDAVQEYIDNFTAAALENLDFNDGITPNEKWMDDNIEGSSRTGNNPKWANAVETPTNKKRNKIRKDNLLGKLKRKAYNKSVQPVVSDKTGNETDKASKIMMKLESTKTKNLNEEFDRIKGLMGYQEKTQ